jgi:hypothetical protein
MDWFCFLQEKNDPHCSRILTRGSHFYVEKLPRAQYSTEVISLSYSDKEHRYSLVVFIFVRAQHCSINHAIKLKYGLGWRVYCLLKSKVSMTIDPPPHLQEFVQNTLFINMINQAKRFDIGVLKAYIVL